jgi:phosphomannomutase/phosphoglucomutase
MGLLKRSGVKGADQSTSGGLGVRGYWMSGVVVMLMLALAASAGSFFLSQIVAREQSSQQARAAVKALSVGLENVIFQRRELIAKLARQPHIHALFEAGDAVALEAEQVRLTSLVPGAEQIRLLPVGVNEPDKRLKPHMGYASLEMLRQAEKRAGVLSAQVHQFGTSNQHIAIAAGVHSEGDESAVGVIHAAYSASELQSVLDALDGYVGRIELQQVPLDKSSFTLVGKGPEIGAPPDSVVPINGTIWQFAYWVGGGSGLSVMGVVIAAAPVLLVVLLSAVFLYLLAQRMVKALKKDQHTVLTLFEALTTGRLPKVVMAQLTDLQPTLDVLHHQVKEFRAKQAGRIKARPPAAETEAIDVSLEEEVVATAPVPKATVGLVEPVDIIPSIYRAYDIRGVVGESLTEAAMATLGQGIGSEIFERGFQTVMVARDARNSSDALQSALIQGLMASGRDVIDLGLVPTPLLNYAVHELNIECGVIVTGSHNPPQYNGLKMVFGGESPSTESIQELRRRIDARQLLQGEGSFDSRDIIDDYIERIVSDIRLGQPLKVVVDCANAAAAVVAPELYRQLGCEVVELYCSVDGNFPNHHPDPGDPKNMEALQKAVVEHQASIGLAFDGDGDRLGVVDSSGKLIWPDRLLMFLAMDVLTREPGGDIIYDVKCSRHLANVILSSGGRPLMWKTGHSNLKNKLKETHALLAGEFSGHIMFSERWYGFDDALYAGARLLEILSLDYRTSAETFAELPDAVSTPEIALRLQEGQAQGVMKAIEQLPDLPGARLVKIDGLRAEFEQGWGLVRASNTTPTLLFRFEADTQEALEQVQSIFRDMLAKVLPDLAAPF